MGWLQDKLGRSSGHITIDNNGTIEHLKVHDHKGVKVQINTAEMRLELEDGTPIINVALGNVNRRVDSITTTTFNGAKTALPGMERIVFDCENIGALDIVVQPMHSTRTDQPEPVEAKLPKDDPKPDKWKGTRKFDPNGKWAHKKAQR